MMEDLYINKIAAEITCKYIGIDHDEDICMVSPTQGENDWREFNIFTNAQDLMDTMDSLAENYCINFVHMPPLFSNKGEPSGYVATGIESGYHKNRVDAVGSACVALVDSGKA